MNLKNRYEWKKVERPITWRPKTEGEELIGFFGGKTIREGKFGQYEVVLVHVPHTGSFMISGVVVAQLFDAAGVGVGWPVRVVWRDYEDLGEDAEGKKKRMKKYEVFIAEGDPVAPEFLPRIADQRPTETRQ